MPFPGDAENAGCTGGFRMNCQQVQTNLSLYLYAELDFAQEEALEQHLDACAFCQRALGREKEWHSALKSEHADVPLSLLSECRRDLSRAIGSPHRVSNARPSWWTWLEGLGFGASRWSLRLAAASFLVFVGFSAGQLLKGTSWGLSSLDEANVAGIHVRDIQPDGKGSVRLIVDHVSEREISGRVDDGQIRNLLLAAMEDPSDPGIRVYSVEVLKGQRGGDVRDALLKSARHDPNAAVRLKALDGLRQFSPDPSTVATLKYVLEHDDNPGVRSEAIDVLAPANQRQQLTPDLANTLEEIIRSEHEDDYVRARCMQMLREMNAPLNVY